MKKPVKWSYFILLAGALLLGSCSASRDLPEGTYMLDKVKVVTDGKYEDINSAQMMNYVRQKGNARWFSAIKIPLGVYAMAGKDSSWINRTLRQMGEAPVIYDTLLARQSCEDLQLALQNKGYLDAQVEMYVKPHHRKMDALFVLHPGQPYFISNFKTDIQDSVIARMIAPRKPLLHNGLQFSTDALNAERSQITTFLQDQGYFRFHKEFITYRAHKDTARHEVGLTMVLHPYRANMYIYSSDCL